MHQSMHHFCIHFMHYIDCYFLYSFCALTLSNAVYPWFLFPFFVFYFFLSFPTLSIMVRKTRAKKIATPSTLTFESDWFRSEKNQETYEKFNIFRLVQAEHKVILDELDLDIRRNFERMGWLLLLEVEYPPSIALIKEFYSNLSVHSDDSNTQYVRSSIRGEEYVITHSIVASALGVPLVQQLMYLYTKTPPLDDIMSFITSTSISWGTDPRVTSHELNKLNYFFFFRFLFFLFGPSLIFTLFPLRDVHFCMPQLPMLL